jgi:hypothetical protein
MIDVQTGATGQYGHVRRIHIIACVVFKTELAHVLGQLEGRIANDLEIEASYLGAGLHSRLSTLKEQVRSILDQKKNEKIILLYGSRCHPDFEEILQNQEVVGFKEKNCISILSDEGCKPSLSDSKTFYLTPGWIVHWKEIFAGEFGLDEISMRQNFGFYDRMLLLANDSVTIEDEQILEFFDAGEIPIEVEPMNLAGFRKRILAAINKAAEL